MKWTSVSSLGLVAVAYAARATDGDGAGGPPAGCSADHPDQFEITTSPLMNKRDLQRRGCNDPNALVLTLNGGQLKDSHNRTGYTASNNQIQFDDPPQSNAVETSGWSLCSNNTLALGQSTIFYECLSGNFYNLYSQNDAGQCQLTYLVALPCGGSSNPSAPAVSQIADGQPQAPAPTATGQPDGSPVSQIGDGQIQAPGPTGQPGGSPVSQIGDGQIQAPGPTGQPGGSPVSQIGDGQIQAPGPSGQDNSQAPSPSEGSSGAGQPGNPSPTGQDGIPPNNEISDGSSQAPGPTESSGAGSGNTASPSSPAAPSKGPVSSGFKTLVDAKAALAIALFSIIVL